MVHIQQLHRLLFAIVRSTTIALPAWHHHCKAHKIRPRVLPCDVVTHWNSTFDMLNFAVQYQAVIDAMTANKSLKLCKFELETEEWTITEDLVMVLLVSICIYHQPILLTVFCSSTRMQHSFSPRSLPVSPPSFLLWTVSRTPSTSELG